MLTTLRTDICSLPGLAKPTIATLPPSKIPMPAGKAVKRIARQEALTWTKIFGSFSPWGLVVHRLLQGR